MTWKVNWRQFEKEKNSHALLDVDKYFPADLHSRAMKSSVTDEGFIDTHNFSTFLMASSSRTCAMQCLVSLQFVEHFPKFATKDCNSQTIPSTASFSNPLENTLSSRGGFQFYFWKVQKLFSVGIRRQWLAAECWQARPAVWDFYLS